MEEDLEHKDDAFIIISFKLLGYLADEDYEKDINAMGGVKNFHLKMYDHSDQAAKGRVPVRMRFFFS